MKIKSICALLLAGTMTLTVCGGATDQASGTIAKASEAVDLGLSVKWAPWNVGATKPGEAGAYFAWGEAQGGKESYGWDTYRHLSQYDEGLVVEEEVEMLVNITNHINKYQVEDDLTSADWYDSTGVFTGDGKTTLEKSDDAASVNWGREWRMPTVAELDELSEKCTWEWKEKGEYESGSLAGYLVTGPNGGSIFLPAAGYRWDSDLGYLGGFGWYGLGSGGYYWSSELDSGYSGYARNLYFDSDDGYAWVDCDRCYGLSVRAVCPAACDDEDDLSADPSTVGGTIAKASEAVDLGLSVKWAPWNVGATKAGEAGAYFAWGEVQGGKESYDWSTYSLLSQYDEGLVRINVDHNWRHINKYQAEDNRTEADWYGSTGAFIGDGKTTLEKSDDAASVNWGGEWRMPTVAELDELSKKCTWEWKEKGEYESGSLAGYLVTGPNGNSVFLPAAGSRRGSVLRSLGSRGGYWSSEHCSGPSGYARDLDFDSGDHYAFCSPSRCHGLSVRAVCPAK